jgi:hypothetical protein
MPACEFIVAQPRPHLRDVVAPGRNAGEDAVKVPVGRPLAGELGRDRRQRGTQPVPIIGGAGIVEPEVRDQDEVPTVNQRLGRNAPAHIRVDPMDRRRREHSGILGTRKRGVLQARVDEPRVAQPVQLIASPCDQPPARLHRRYPQPAGQQAAR